MHAQHQPVERQGQLGKQGVGFVNGDIVQDVRAQQVQADVIFAGDGHRRLAAGDQSDRLALHVSFREGLVAGLGIERTQGLNVRRIQGAGPVGAGDHPGFLGPLLESFEETQGTRHLGRHIDRPDDLGLINLGDLLRRLFLNDLEQLHLQFLGHLHPVHFREIADQGDVAGRQLIGLAAAHPRDTGVQFGDFIHQDVIVLGQAEFGNINQQQGVLIAFLRSHAPQFL